MSVFFSFKIHSIFNVSNYFGIYLFESFTEREGGRERERESDFSSSDLRWPHGQSWARLKPAAGSLIRVSHLSGWILGTTSVPFSVYEQGDSQHLAKLNYCRNFGRVFDSEQWDRFWIYKRTGLTSLLCQFPLVWFHVPQLVKPILCSRKDSTPPCGHASHQVGKGCGYLIHAWFQVSGGISWERGSSGLTGGGDCQVRGSCGFHLVTLG